MPPMPPPPDDGDDVVEVGEGPLACAFVAVGDPITSAIDCGSEYPGGALGLPRGSGEVCKERGEYLKSEFIPLLFSGCKIGLLVM